MGFPLASLLGLPIGALLAGTIMAFDSSALNLAAVISPIIGGLIFANGGFRLLGTWTALIAVLAFAAAFALRPRPQVVPREPEKGVSAEDHVAECASV
jgi:MFS family permease